MNRNKKLTYSFIKPKLKPLFSLFSIIWLSLICFACVACLLVNIAIKVLSYNLEKSSVKNQVSYNDYSRKISIIKDYLENLKIEQQTAEDIFATNSAVKSSVRNLFDIVPDTITLTVVEFSASGLVIKGKTPSKEAYLLLMEAPLKSIFTNTKTNFYQLENGWLNFSSINTSKEDFDE